jgi:hypothetical protein
VDEVAGEVAKSWSGSWLGYHSRVYRSGLRPAPPGAHFRDAPASDIGRNGG